MSRVTEDRWDLAGPPFWLLAVLGVVVAVGAAIEGRPAFIAGGLGLAVVCMGIHVLLRHLHSRGL